MAEKKKFYIALNKGASSFTCPVTLFKISNDMIKPVGTTVMNSKAVKQALRNGHLVQKSEAEFNTYSKNVKKAKTVLLEDASKDEYIKDIKDKLVEAVEAKEASDKRVKALEKENEELKERVEELESNSDDDDDTIDFEEMTMSDIKEYLNENYTLDEDDMDKMESLKKAELVEFANQIIKDNEEGE